MRRTHLTLRRMKTDLSGADNAHASPYPVPKHAVTESFKNSRLACGSMTSALPKICSAFWTGAARDHAGGLRCDLGRTSCCRIEDKATLMKKKLAHRILVSATAGGVRDLETLKEQALRSLAGGLRVSGSQTGASEAA
jgi:hypothetical protein